MVQARHRKQRTGARRALLTALCFISLKALYTKYEAEGRARRVMPARQLWFAILEAQVGSQGSPQPLNPNP